MPRRQPAVVDEGEMPAADGAAVEPGERTDVFALLPKLLPELSLALAALGIALFPERMDPRLRGALQTVVIVEVLFCLAQASLTDIATRLRKPPPWWLGLLILGGLAIFNQPVVSMTLAALREGWQVFVPYAWSLVERGRELWTMPNAPRLEKLRRRALVSGRLSLVLVGGGVAVALAAASYAVSESVGGFSLVDRYAGWLLAAAFGTAAFDVARVHRPAFARRPRALFGRFDPLGVDDLSRLSL